MANQCYDDYLAEKDVNTSFCTCFPSTCWIWLCWAALNKNSKQSTKENSKLAIKKLQEYQTNLSYLENADCKGGGGSFDLRLLKGRSRSFTGEVNEFLSINTFRFGDLISPF